MIFWSGIKYAIGLSLAGITLFAQAQTTLKGHVREKEGIPGVSVLLLSEDSLVIKNAITDSIGHFIFQDVKSGIYRVSARMLGYTSYISLPLGVVGDEIVLPDIPLKEDPTILNEIVVSGEREFLEQKYDRVVFNLQNSASTSGNTVLEVLQKSPGVAVNRQANVIRVNGRTGVTIMINERIVQMTGEAMMQLLEGISTTNIEKIELITTPQAGYDAEGGGGIIHIVTRKPVNMGTSGSFSLSGGATAAETFNGSLSLNHMAKNYTWFLDYSVNRRHNLHYFDSYERLNNGPENDVVLHSYRPNLTTQQNLRTGVEWRLSDRTTLSFGVTAFLSVWKLTADTQESDHARVDSTVSTTLHITERNIWFGTNASMLLQTKVGSRSQLTTSADYLFYDNSNPSHYITNSLFIESGEQQSSEIDLKKSTPIYFLVGRLDYHFTPQPTLTWDAGFKTVYSTLSNTVDIQRLINNTWQPDNTFSSYSSLDEHIYAGYVSNKWAPKSNVEINSGLRYEYTHTNISSLSQSDIVNRKYGYFFPVLSVRKTIDAEKEIQVAYSRRMSRPGYTDIAPYVFFWGFHTFASGNTKLYPAVVDAITTSYKLKQLTLSAGFTHSWHEIATVQPERDGQSNIIYRSQNLKYLNTISVTGSYSATVYPWWDIQASVTPQYQIGRSPYFNKTLTAYGVNFSFVSRIKLPGNFSIEISDVYQPRTISGISQYLSTGSLNAGIQKSFGSKGTFTLAMDDILYQNYWRFKTTLPDYNLVTYFRYDFHNQYIRLSYVRKIGSFTSRQVRTSGADEERGRVR